MLSDQLALRKTIAADVHAIVAIDRHPEVRPHQLRASCEATADDWIRWLDADLSRCNYGWESTTILWANEVIGSITKHFWDLDDGRTYQCGWNLAPLYWGRGIMHAALSTELERLFNQSGAGNIFAECFGNNERCIRLLEKLRFQVCPISFEDRVKLAWSYRCTNWILRFHLDADRWRAERAQSPTVPEA